METRRLVKTIIIHGGMLQTDLYNW